MPFPHGSKGSRPGYLTSPQGPAPIELYGARAVRISTVRSLNSPNWTAPFWVGCNLRPRSAENQERMNFLPPDGVNRSHQDVNRR